MSGPCPEGSDRPLLSRSLSEGINYPNNSTFEKSPSTNGETWRTRLRICCTIPHATVLFSLINLSVFVVATIYSENAHKLKVDELSQRCAIVYLAPSNNTNINNLGVSLKSLNLHFKSDMKYRIVILHEDIPPVVQGRLQTLSEMSLQFTKINLPRYPNVTTSDHLSMNHSSKDAVLQAVTRFWFYTAMLSDSDKSGLAGIDYIVRLDPNSAFTAPIPHDFVKNFVVSGAQYGYQAINEDCIMNRTKDLKQLAISYVDLNGITPRSMDLWSPITRSGENPCLPYFKGPFEVINMRFFRSHSGIQAWIHVVDSNGGITRHQWRDASLRYLTVSLYATPEKLVRYSEKAVPYRQKVQNTTIL